jgi:hypothetical protein
MKVEIALGTKPLGSPEERLKAELDEGEKLLWRGQPIQGARLGSGGKIDGMKIFYPLGSACLGTWTITTALRLQGGDAFETGVLLAFGSFLGLFAIFLAWGGLFIDARRRRESVYGLTDRRVLFLLGSPSPEVKDFDLKATAFISLREEGQGRGTIFFGPQSVRILNVYQTIFGPPDGTLTCFDGIEDARAVYELVLTTRRLKELSGQKLRLKRKTGPKNRDKEVD